MSRPSTAGGRGVGGDGGEKELGETTKKIVYTYPLIRVSSIEMFLLLFSKLQCNNAQERNCRTCAWHVIPSNLGYSFPIAK